MHKEICDYTSKDNNDEIDNEIETFTNTIIYKITNNLENFHYNVIIAYLHEIYNFYSKIVKNKINEKKIKINFIKILKCLSPIIPHICHECLEQLNVTIRTDWPKVDKKYLLKKEFNIVVQINGKKEIYCNLTMKFQKRIC